MTLEFMLGSLIITMLITCFIKRNEIFDAFLNQDRWHSKVRFGKYMIIASIIWALIIMLYFIITV